MKQLVYLMLAMVLFSSCNQKELKSLRIANANLKNRVVKLNNQLGYQELDCQEKIDELESELSFTSRELITCQMNFDGYKYGNGKSITKFVKGHGLVSIQGADKIIDFFMSREIR